MADTPLTVAKVAELLSTPGWQMNGGQDKSELGLLIGVSHDVIEAQGNGSNLLVGYRRPLESGARLNKSALWSNCSRHDGTDALIFGYPCQFSHPSGGQSVIRVSDLDPTNTVMTFTRASLPNPSSLL